MANTTGLSTQERVNLFRSGVEKVLRNWTALQLAVEHATGGPKSQELAANFLQYVVEIFCERGNFEPEDISDLLAEIMDTQFNTWCEDNSPDEVASLLCNLHHIYLDGSLEELKKQVENIPFSSASQSKEWRTEEVPCQTDQIGKSVTSLTCLEEVESESQGMENVDDTPEEDLGWTTVTSRRRRMP